MLVIEGRSREELIKEERAQWEEIPLKDHMALYMEKGLSKKDAMKQVAKDRGVGKREVYQMLLLQE